MSFLCLMLCNCCVTPLYMPKKFALHDINLTVSIRTNLSICMGRLMKLIIMLFENISKIMSPGIHHLMHGLKYCIQMVLGPQIRSHSREIRN